MTRAIQKKTLGAVLRSVCRSWQTDCNPRVDTTLVGRAFITSTTTSKNPLDDAEKKNPKDGIPPHAKALGYLGAVPFWLFSTPVVQQFPVLEVITGLSASDFGTLQVAYGATILSFLGGVHWGLSMTTLTPLQYTAERYMWSVMPCLAAFPTLAMPTAQGAGIQAALLALVYATDRSWATRGALPPWYMSLRAPLSTLAASGLCMTAVLG